VPPEGANGVDFVGAGLCESTRDGDGNGSSVS